MNGTRSPRVYTTSWVDDGGSNTTGRSPSETWRAVPASVNSPSSRWEPGEICLHSWFERSDYPSLCSVFFQGNYWSSNVNEVQGFVMDQEGKVIHRLFGKWHEGLYCGVPPSAKCVWRPGGRPCLHSQIEGFHKELTPSKALAVYVVCRLHAHRLWAVLWLHQVCHRTERSLPRAERRAAPRRHPVQTWPTVGIWLPLTCFPIVGFIDWKVTPDSRRYLEEGNLEMASSEKQRIEDLQRTRRRWREDSNVKLEPCFFK